MSQLRDRLASVPDQALPRSREVEVAIEHTVTYLASDGAQRSLDADTYWPKWNSPWWHMLLLHELGETRRIPERAVAKMIEGLNALPIKIFPIQPDDMPTDADPYRDTSCHCAVGSIYHVLATYGVDIDRALPWIPQWFVRYQMADGGRSCDNDAYLQPDQCPSSMVGTVALYEAMLLRRPRTADERSFVERATAFLIGRELVHGSSSVFNAVEREVAPVWLLPCFPRFYLYDVLRGIAALVRRTELDGTTLPLAAVSVVIERLLAEFSDGIVRVQRRSLDGLTTIAQHDGTWRREPAARFPLLDAVGELGAPSEALTRQWTVTRHALVQLLDANRLV